MLFITFEKVKSCVRKTLLNCLHTSVSWIDIALKKIEGFTFPLLLSYLRSRHFKGNIMSFLLFFKVINTGILIRYTNRQDNLTGGFGYSID